MQYTRINCCEQLQNMRIRPFPWKSILLAPFASVPALTLTGLGSSAAGMGSDFGWGIFFGLLLAVPICFLFVLLVGVPVFLIFRSYIYLLLVTTCALGFAVPFLMLFGDAPLRTTLGAACSGVSVAIAAYLLRPEDKVAAS
ncbi:hypothetical protein [Janthinobacterium sp. RB2R34]|uniref:hypothetical protein n=1 Tax=Janthinobacterium sp. RB2R34 TaxID=3424193 RepID=UPI003F1E54EB